MRTPNGLAVFVLGVGAAFLASPAAAQESGRIAGTVTDAQAAVLPGATVTLTSADGQALRTVFTGPEGTYELPSVPAGAYGLRVELSGFRPALRDRIEVSGTTATVDVQLELSGLLEAIVVTGTRAEQEVGKIPAALAVVDTEQALRGQQGTNINEVLKRVPGVAMRVHLDGSTRATASVRGAGAQSTFGARGVRILVDGFPKNNAGGSGQDFINIDLESVRRTEVVRGPSSALYGNQAGGVINFITETGSSRPYGQFRQTLGSFGLLKSHFKLSTQAGKFSFFGSAFHTQSDGWRDFSSFRSTGVHSKLLYTFDDGGSVMTTLSYETLRQDIPGSLSAAEVAQNPRQANPALVPTGAIRGDIDEFRVGVVLNKPLSARDYIEFSGYYVPRPIYLLTVATIRNDQFFINRGANLRYLNVGSLFGLDNRLTIGVDYQNTPLRNAISSRTNGASLQQLKEDLETFGFYVQDELSLGSKLILSLGGRFDSVSFGFDDLQRPGELGSTFVRKFERFTPKVGAVLRPRPNLSFYGNFSEGLETPVSEQLRNSPFAAGEFVLNVGLRPMIYRSGELGVKGEIGRLSLDAAVFRQDIDDFIVTRQVLRPDGQTTFTASLNAARVRQVGVELGASLRLAPSLLLNATYTYSDYTFSEFDALGEDLGGNRLAGVPEHDVFAELRYQPEKGVYGGVEVKSVGRYFLNDANQFSNEPYTVFSATAGYEHRISEKVLLEPFLTVNNVFGESYTSLPQVNDGSQRYFNPMPGANVVGGVRLRF